MASNNNDMTSCSFENEMSKNNERNFNTMSNSFTERPITSTNMNTDCSLPKADTYADALLRTLYSFKPPSSSMPLWAFRQRRWSYPQSTMVSQPIVNELANGSSDNQQSLADPSSLSSSSSSLFSSSSLSSSSTTTTSVLTKTGTYFTLEARLPLVKNKVEQLEKFKRLLSRLDSVYNNNNNNNNNSYSNMSTSALPPPSASALHMPDRYLFRSPSGENRSSRKSSTMATPKKAKLNNNSASSSTPPLARKRYKFSSNTSDQNNNNNNNNIYKFSNGHTEQRSHSTDADRYYFPPDNTVKQQPQHTLTFIRGGDGIEPHTVTFINGTSATTDKKTLPSTKSIQPTSITPDTRYLFSKTTESQKNSPVTSLTNPEDVQLRQRQQPHIIFDSITELSPTSQIKRLRTSSTSPEHRQVPKRSPTRIDTITSTNGSLSTLRRSPPSRVQNVRFDPLSTPRSYLDEARERLAGKKRGRSPQAFQQSVDRLVSSTNKKYIQSQILSPPLPYQTTNDYISQYYAHEEPPIDYPMDSDDDEQHKRSYLYSRGTNRAHTQIMKNVNKSLIDGNYLADTGRMKQLGQNFHRYLRSFENQSLQRELNYDLIRCFSSTYLNELRREENRNHQTRLNMRSYTYEDVQDIHMSSALEAFKMKRAVDKEKLLRLSVSYDGQITPSTVTSPIGPGLLSPLLTSFSPIMTGSLNENIDAQSGGFETDRRSQKSQPSIAQTAATNLRNSHLPTTPNVDLFLEIMQDRFRGVDATIAGQVSNASQYRKQEAQHQATKPSTAKTANDDSDLDIKSNSSFWSDEEEEQIANDNQQKTIPNQKQLSRYLSTVNRSLLDRPSNLIADFYISKLNRSMKESVRQVETIARDKAIMRQTRNREFMDESTNKLGRSLSAEHLYQVRKEHLRYKQPFTTPTSFTVEDVADIYKPFVLENFKRKLAIEFERRRRTRQEQLMSSIISPPIYIPDPIPTTSSKTLPTKYDTSTTSAIDRPSHQPNLSRTSIMRTNEPGVLTIETDPRQASLIVPPPIVQKKRIRTHHASRILAEDCSNEAVHHVSIISPPTSYSFSQPNLVLKQTTTADIVHQTIVPPPDFIRRNIVVRKDRAHTNIVSSISEDLIDSPLSTTQQILFKAADYDPNLQQASEVVTATSSRAPAKIYTPPARIQKIRVAHALTRESESGNHELSMVKITPITTLNQSEINELTTLAEQAQRLQIPVHDYERAFIMLSQEPVQSQHNISPQPLLLATANINHLTDEQNEQVTRRFDEEIQRQRSQLIQPIPEHMAKVEHDIAIFENISTSDIQQYTRNKLNEIPVDSGIVSLNTSQASEHPIILNSARVNQSEPSEEGRLEQLRDDNYNERRVRASDLMRHVDVDPNANIRPVRRDQINVLENTQSISPSTIQNQCTTLREYETFSLLQTLQSTNVPMIYESVDQTVVHRMPTREHLTSSQVEHDNQASNRSTENPILWGKPVPVKQNRPLENRLPDTIYEQIKTFETDQTLVLDTVRSRQEPLQQLETLQRPKQNIVYKLGENGEISLSRTSSFSSDQDLKLRPHGATAVKQDSTMLTMNIDITRPLYQHPPVNSQFYQEQTSADIDAEPMPVHLETSWINDVSHGRASLTETLQPLNAAKTLAQPNLQALPLEDLATPTSALNKHHATPLIEGDYRQSIFEKIDKHNHPPVIIYDSDWTNEKANILSDNNQSNAQNAREKYPSNVEFHHAKINNPETILSREHYQHIEDSHEETVQTIETPYISQDHLIEHIESNKNLNLKSIPTHHSTGHEEILCHPINNRLNINDEHVSTIPDDSLLLHQQQQSNIQINASTTLENPISSSSLLTLNYPHTNQHINPPFEQVINQNFPSDQHQQLTVQIEKPSELLDSTHIQENQPEPHTNQNKPTQAKHQVRHTAQVILNYAHHNGDPSSSWEHVSNQNISNQSQNLQQHLHYKPRPSSPRYLPLITPAVDESTLQDSDRIANEFQQAPLLHENVRIESCDSLSLIPSEQVEQSQPLYFVSQQQTALVNENDHSLVSPIHSDHIDHATTATETKVPLESLDLERSPITIDININVRPAYSETSSINEMESFLNRFEDSLEPEQRLPLVDQISLSYATSLRSTQDATQRAIERYEQKYPFFSRSLPLEWLQAPALPHDEQLVEQWIVEKNLETIQQQVELKTNSECSGVVDITATTAAAIPNDAYSLDERFEDEIANSLNTKDTNNEHDDNYMPQAAITSHCSPTSDYETDSLDKDIDTISTTTSIAPADQIYTATPARAILPVESLDVLPIVSVDSLLEKPTNEKKSKRNLTTDLLLSIGCDQYKSNDDDDQIIHRAKVNELEYEDLLLLSNFDAHEREFLNIFFEPSPFHLPIVDEMLIYQISFNNQYTNLHSSNFLLPTVHLDDDLLPSTEYKTNQLDILSFPQINHRSEEDNDDDEEEELKNISNKYEQPSYIEHYHIQSLNPFSQTLYATIDEPPTIIDNDADHSTLSILPDAIPSSSSTAITIRHVEEYIHRTPDEETSLPVEPTFVPLDAAHQTTQSDDLDLLSEQKYITVYTSTPTPSMRIARTSRTTPLIDDELMALAADLKTDSSTKVRYTNESESLNYAATTSRDQLDHLPPKLLSPDRMPDPEQARLISSTMVPSSDVDKSEVLIRDTIVQHVSEDEKSTSSEEVVFEEWSEEFRCRRTDVYDKNTNRLLRTSYDQTGERIKSDVVKEEYKEKNERIKGHKSYDIVKEVYRRVPAHAIDTTKKAIISTDPPRKPEYEELAKTSSLIVPTTTTTTTSIHHTELREPTPPNRHWSSEDTYTTEIVYDQQTARDIESVINAARLDGRIESVAPQSTSTTVIYDHVRPGQYVPLTSTSQTAVSKEQSTVYDRISNIITSSSTHTADRRPQENDETVSEEYRVELERKNSDRQSSPSRREKQQHAYSSEEEASDSYAVTGTRPYQSVTSGTYATDQKHDADWRNKFKQMYAPTSDDDQFEQLRNSTNGYYTTQQVATLSINMPAQFQDYPKKTSGCDNSLYESNKLNISPPLRYTTKDFLVHVSRESSPDKQLRQEIYFLRSSSSDDDEEENKELVLVDSMRSRETTKKIISSYSKETRPQPPKRSSSSSSIIEERRARFEQQDAENLYDTSSRAKANSSTYSRVGILKNTFESVTNGNIKGDQSKTRTPMSTTLTEQRRRMFEDQEQTSKTWASTSRRTQQITPTIVVPRRRIFRISGRRPTDLIDDLDSSEHRMSETKIVPPRVIERVSRFESNLSKSPTRVQSTDGIGRSDFATIKSSFEASITKTTEQLPAAQTSTDYFVKDRRIITSIDSDVSGSSPPIYQSTPKSTKPKIDEDAGHESEDELSDQVQTHEQLYDTTRRHSSKTHLKEFSQSSPQTIEDTTYVAQRTKSSFNENTMENILSHVPPSKGKGLLIELSPHVSQETTITTTTTNKQTRDPNKSAIGTDSGIFEYSTAGNYRQPAATSSSSWRNNATSSMFDDGNHTPTMRDSGVYGDSLTTTLSSRYGRRQPSDTDQTTFHGGDDSVSRSTYKYETEMMSNDGFNQQKQQQQVARTIRRQIAGTPPSDYETISNYYSGLSAQRKVPITTQSRSIMPRPIVVDEIETIETETCVEHQVQRTHEIKESTTTREGMASPNAPRKVITTTTTTTTTTAPVPLVRSSDSSSDEASRTVTPSNRVVLTERTNYYEPTKFNAAPVIIRSQSESSYTPTNQIRQQTQIVQDNNYQQNRYESPQSDSVLYPIPPPAAAAAATTTTTTTTTVVEEAPPRVEETWFKPIQRDRSHDSLLQSTPARSSVRTLSNGPPSRMEITSLSPESQVTFGNYTSDKMIAIVRVPQLSNNGSAKPSPVPLTIRHGTSEPELRARLRQEEEEEEEEAQQQQKPSQISYERIHPTSYRSSPIHDHYQQRSSRSRTSPYDSTNEYSPSLSAHARSSSYHSVLHDRNQQQQQNNDQYVPTSYTTSGTRHQIKTHRTNSLGNLIGPNLEFEIEIEKRPPQLPAQPTVVAVDQTSRAIVTTSKDGRVSIQNVTARPGNTVVINSDFHSSDRSLNRSSGYFSADELRSQGVNTNYSSDEQSSAAAMNLNQNSLSSNTPSVHARRYRNNEQTTSKLPSHYRTRQNNNYQPLNNESFDRVNQIVNRHYRQPTNTNSHNPITSFTETIDQIDALYNNLDVQANDNYGSSATYDFSKTTSGTNRRQNLVQNPNEYQKRYTSTGFSHMSNTDNMTPTNSTLQYFVSPSIVVNNDKRQIDTNRAYSDNENLNMNTEHNRHWSSTSLNDIAMSTPMRPSQSLSSSGILADYTTPGSISPSSGFGSTHNVVLQQNRLNSQGQMVHRNRASVKQVKQKSAAKKKFGNTQGQYSDEDDDNDSAGGHDSPLSDGGRPQQTTPYSNRYQ